MIAADLHARLDKNQHPVVSVRVAKPVNARNRRDDNYIMPFEQPARGAHPQPVDLVVDRRFFFYV